MEKSALIGNSLSLFRHCITKSTYVTTNSSTSLINDRCTLLVLLKCLTGTAHGLNYSKNFISSLWFLIALRVKSAVLELLIQINYYNT